MAVAWQPRRPNDLALSSPRLASCPASWPSAAPGPCRLQAPRAAPSITPTPATLGGEPWTADWVSGGPGAGGLAAQAGGGRGAQGARSRGARRGRVSSGGGLLLSLSAVGSARGRHTGTHAGWALPWVRPRAWGTLFCVCWGGHSKRRLRKRRNQGLDSPRGGPWLLEPKGRRLHCLPVAAGARPVALGRAAWRGPAEHGTHAPQAGVRHGRGSTGRAARRPGSRAADPTPLHPADGMDAPETSLWLFRSREAQGLLSEAQGGAPTPCPAWGAGASLSRLTAPLAPTDTQPKKVRKVPPGLPSSVSGGLQWGPAGQGSGLGDLSAGGEFCPGAVAPRAPGKFPSVQLTILL